MVSSSRSLACGLRVQVGLHGNLHFLLIGPEQPVGRCERQAVVDAVIALVM